MLDNIILLTDSYKETHWKMYPPETRTIYSYLEARRGGEYGEVMFFGLQYFLMKYFAGAVVSAEKIERAARFVAAHFGAPEVFNREGWEHLLSQHGGTLPVEIRAVPEGLVVPEGNVLLTIENTCPRCAWLVNHLETVLVELWYPCTVGTISREMKKIIRAGLERSGTPSDDVLALKLHDFGFRGSTSPESAALGGAAHLVNFQGTDTLAACELLIDSYAADMPGVSIPAAEHSTITVWGEDAEGDAFAHILKQYPAGLVSVVSDSWDVYRACRELWGERLKEQVRQRQGCLVVRPDSGPPEVVVPDCLDVLGERFGFTVNPKGYRVLPDTVRLIQGDGIKRQTLAGIVDAILERGWSLDCVTFGSGGGLLQDCNRDTQNFALKCAYGVVGDEAREVWKRPATDPMKDSKRGRLMLVKGDTDRRYMTVAQGTPGASDVLVPVFRDGQLLHPWTLEQVRARAALG